VKPRAPLLVAIAGGSGSGKTWLAERLERALGRQALRLSLDDFYRDRSRIAPARRARVNFDHPRAIDWNCLRSVLRRLLSGHPARVPCYDFATHCRRRQWRTLHPKPIVLLDGLWVLRRRELRRWIALGLYLDCPAEIRFRRRLARDLAARGRTRASVREQFLRMVEPMHARFVAPQQRRADLVLQHGFSEELVLKLAQELRKLSSEFQASNSRRHS